MYKAPIRASDAQEDSLPWGGEDAGFDPFGDVQFFRGFYVLGKKFL